MTVQSMHTTIAALIDEDESIQLEDLDRVLGAWEHANWRDSHDDLERRMADMTPDRRPKGRAHPRPMTLAHESQMTRSRQHFPTSPQGPIP